MPSPLPSLSVSSAVPEPTAGLAFTFAAPGKIDTPPLKEKYRPPLVSVSQAISSTMNRTTSPKMSCIPSGNVSPLAAGSPRFQPTSRMTTSTSLPERLRSCTGDFLPPTFDGSTRKLRSSSTWNISYHSYGGSFEIARLIENPSLAPQYHDLRVHDLEELEPRALTVAGLDRPFVAQPDGPHVWRRGAGAQRLLSVLAELESHLYEQELLEWFEGRGSADEELVDQQPAGEGLLPHGGHGESERARRQRVRNTNASAALSPALIGRRRPRRPSAGIGAFTMLNSGRAMSCRTNSTFASAGRSTFIFGVRSDSGGRVLSRSTVRTVSMPVNPTPGIRRSIGWHVPLEGLLARFVVAGQCRRGHEVQVVHAERREASEPTRPERERHGRLDDHVELLGEPHLDVHLDRGVEGLAEHDLEAVVRVGPERAGEADVGPAPGWASSSSRDRNGPRSVLGSSISTGSPSITTSVPVSVTVAYTRAGASPCVSSRRKPMSGICPNTSGYMVPPLVTCSSASIPTASGPAPGRTLRKSSASWRYSINGVTSGVLTRPRTWLMREAGHRATAAATRPDRGPGGMPSRSSRRVVMALGRVAGRAWWSGQRSRSRSRARARSRSRRRDPEQLSDRAVRRRDGQVRPDVDRTERPKPVAGERWPPEEIERGDRIAQQSRVPSRPAIPRCSAHSARRKTRAGLSGADRSCSGIVKTLASPS